MATTEIAALGGLILQIASSIQNTGNNWYRASADWTEFPQKVESLRRKHSYWLASLTEYGMLSDSSLMETLREAEVSLREEQARLSKRQSKSRTKWLSKVSMTMFPAKIGMNIQRVIDAFDAIVGQLEFEQKTKLALDWRMMYRAPSLALRSDKCYVPFTVSESRVYSALEDADGSPVVLLYGLWGKGKSTLARHTGLHYYNTAKSDVFERVVFLDCGREANHSTKQLELLEQLGPSTAAGSEAQEKGESSSAATIRRLSGFLRHQKLLLILDDVWEGEFLRRMVDLCGPNVRCLVTSRRGDLCKSLRFPVTRIQIEDAQLRDAGMEILAGHVGFRNKQIPPHLQEVAKKIVDETQGHPLALASIATAIEDDRSDEFEEWDIVYHTLLHVLRSTQDTASVVGDEYSKCFWSTMRLSIQSLEPNALKLLILVSMCTGPSVPEEILQILFIGYVFHPGLNETFRKARKELEIQEWITITTLDNERSWSVHTLLKLFMEEEMSDRKESMFTLLAPVSATTESTVKHKVIGERFGDDDAVIQTAICALYFDKHFSDRAASSLNIPLNQLNNLRRNAIEPITRLLGRPVNDRWTAQSQASAKQVFWTYISNCALHKDGILHLLAMPMSILPVSTVLHGIATIEDHPDLSGTLIEIFDRIRKSTGSQEIVKNPRNLSILVKSLINDNNSCLQLYATWTLEALAASAVEETKRLIIQFPGALEQLIRLLSKDGANELQERATKALANLAASEVEEMNITVIEFRGALEQLTRLLRMDIVPGSQRFAAMALANLAAANFEETKRTIIQFPGALEQLITLLSKDGVPELQEQATRALVGLTGFAPEEIKRTIIQFPGALEQLTRLLCMDTAPKSQKFATNALANLAASNLEEIKRTIIQFPRALGHLTQLLSMDTVPESQKFAAMVLVNLALSRVEEIKHTIIQFPGALEQLTRLLRMDTDPESKLFAAMALAHLASSNLEEIKRTIIHFPGALGQLIQLLRMDTVPKSQRFTAMALANLALSNLEETRCTIIQFPGALELITLLSKDGVPKLQEQATRALARLTDSARQEIKCTIVRFSRALEQLTLLLCMDTIPEIQKFATNALANLASSNLEDIKRTIIQFPGALGQLNRLLHMDTVRESQEFATMALANLAASNLEETKGIIIQFPGALGQLTRLLRMDTIPESQKFAINALANLAASNVEETKCTIIQFPGALGQLTRLLRMDTVPEIQRFAVMALANLAASNLEETKCTIIQFPRALEQLIRLLSKDAVPELQLQATRALANLAWFAPQEIKLTIIQFPGALEQLTRLVTRDAVSGLHHQATRALAHLRSLSASESSSAQSFNFRGH